MSDLPSAASQKDGRGAGPRGGCGQSEPWCPISAWSVPGGILWAGCEVGSRGQCEPSLAGGLGDPGCPWSFARAPGEEELPGYKLGSRQGTFFQLLVPLKTYTHLRGAGVRRAPAARTGGAGGPDGTWQGTALGQSDGHTGARGGSSSQGSPPGPVSSQGAWKAQRSLHPAPETSQVLSCGGHGQTGGRLSPGSVRATRGSSCDARCGFMGLGVMRGALWRNQGAQDPSWGAPAGPSTWGGRARDHEGPPRRGDSWEQPAHCPGVASRPASLALQGMEMSPLTST